MWDFSLFNPSAINVVKLETPQDFVGSKMEGG